MSDNPEDRVQKAIKDMLNFLETPKESRTDDGKKLYDHVKSEILTKYGDKLNEEQAEQVTAAVFHIVIEMYGGKLP